jgi:hypothetical protein
MISGRESEMAYRFVRVPGSDLFRRIEWPAGAAYDAKNGLGESVPPPPPRYYSREGARRCLQFLARKLKPADLAEAWRMIQARLDQAGLEPDEAPLHRNGHG